MRPATAPAVAVPGSAECGVRSEKLNKGNAGDLTQRPRRVRALHAPCLRAIRVNNPRACGARTLHLPFFAPTGRRTVAAGGAPAAAQRAVRNPWERSCFNTSAPLGAAEAPGRAADQCPFAGPGNSFAPPGRKEGGIEPVSFHGLRIGPQPAKAGRLRPRRSTRGYTPSPLWGFKPRPAAVPGHLAMPSHFDLAADLVRR